MATDKDNNANFSASDVLATGYKNVRIGKHYLSETAGPTIHRFVWRKLRYEWGNWGSIEDADGTVIGKIWRLRAGGLG